MTELGSSPTPSSLMKEPCTDLQNDGPGTRNLDSAENQALTPLPPNELKLRYQNWTLLVPSSPLAAQQLIHTLRAHREACIAEHAMAQRRLHEMVSAMNFLRSLIDERTRSIRDAEHDIGEAHLALHAHGVALGNDGCSLCRNGKDALIA
ncbi:hypothetical protein MIND_01147000 [Mycena indigotica]|uniref:Uncharacterized protein n=1 Tax=Mycena indigotica TaxID=2126181 RepID=A0A8H6S7L9_9AGAR|nr:uncharacterized protein MIND_01143200 [Mycena indigotica]XP_037215833.1 uncharacterized protein MIND_01147000 [Mycena indigotica]KAF7293638.1 hypothetical protein MIND_01143200 [Mycena indigotica]KAF7293670.1 hypothetical protein MIND_01147000 [Mycena indigotica]